MPVLKQLLKIHKNSIFDAVGGLGLNNLVTLLSSGEPIVTSRGDNFLLKFDMDEIAPTLSFTLPYLDKKNKLLFPNSEEAIFTTLEKYNTIQLYAGLFDIDPGTVQTSDLTLVFTGFIDEIYLSKRKESYTYSFKCLGTFAVAASLGMQADYNTVETIEFLNTVLRESKANLILGTDQVINKLTDEASQIIVNWQGGKILRDIIDNVRSKYGYKITQRFDGKILFIEPASLFLTQADVVPENRKYSLEKDIFELDYGDLTSFINAITVIAHDGSSVTVIDPSTLNAKVGSFQTAQSNVLAPKVIRRMDLNGPEELFAAAKNLLVDQTRNQALQFKVLLEPELAVGDLVSVADDDRFGTAANPIPFIVKTVEHAISKQGGASTTMNCYRSLLQGTPVIMEQNVGAAQELGIATVSAADQFDQSRENTEDWRPVPL